MDYTAMITGLNNAVPMNKTLGLEVIEMGPGTGVVRLPDDVRLHNHVGSQHAGALFAAGEAASGAAMGGALFAHLAGVTPLAAKAEIAYKRLAKGVILATGRLPPTRRQSSRSSTPPAKRSSAPMST